MKPAFKFNQPEPDYRAAGITKPDAETLAIIDGDFDVIGAPAETCGQ